MTFPTNPSNGDTYVRYGRVYEYDSTLSMWKIHKSGISLNDMSDVDIATNTPVSGDALVWSGSVFEPGSVSGASSYATIEDLPVVGNSDGDLALVTSTNTLYVSNSGGWYVIVAPDPAPSVPPFVNLWMLAGGGAGGTGWSTNGVGGGGGGGVVNTTYSVSPDTLYVITIGAGGAAGLASGPYGGAVTSNGGDTVFENDGLENLVPRVVAYGGGCATQVGGSGGGGYASVGAAGTTNQGNAGGSSLFVYNSAKSGGGGGGAGAVGEDNATTANARGGLGGVGTTVYSDLLILVGEGFYVNSTTRSVGAGGSGSNSKGNGYVTGTAGVQGSGSGGGTSNSVVTQGGNATAWLGAGGGGGGGGNNGIYTGGNGSAGFMVVYYPVTYPVATTTGSPTYYNDGTNHYFKFKASGTITF